MSKKTILCVDDEKIILNSIKAQLKEVFGSAFNYETAENAEEAIDLLNELYSECNELIVVIVTDWLMPGIKGDELLVKIHRLFPKTIKIMLTGQADIASIERAYKEANMFRCLSKPWSKDELIETINSAMLKF